MTTSKLYCISLIFSGICALVILTGCQTSPQSDTASKSDTASTMQALDIQGHRGCRGLMPENSIPGFLKAIDMGVTTLELDVVISQDSQVVVSHEPFLSHQICRNARGESIAKEQERDYNLFQMTYEEIKACDCGSSFHPGFPEQEKIALHKPLLSEVIQVAEAYTQATASEPLWYNIETKSHPDTDNTYHPEPEIFVDLLIGVIREKGVSERVTIQSFDPRTLKVAHQKYSDIQLVLLVGDEQSPEFHLNRLGFIPEVYSPHYRLVNEELVALCQEKGMKLVPWTVNDPEAIQQMLDLGVDGIISDYPDRVVALVK